VTLIRYQLTQEDIYQKIKNMGSPFKRRSALKHNILDNYGQPWEHKHGGRVRGSTLENTPVINDPGYLENQRFGNRNVFSSAGDGTKINANDQQFNQSTQIANMYNSGRLNPEGFNTQASYRVKNKIDGGLSFNNNKMKVEFPGSTKNIPNWMNNTRNVNFYDGDDAELTAPSTQYTPEQINSILGQTGTASFVPDGNGGFAFESGGGGNTYDKEVAFSGDYKDDLAMPPGYSLQTPEPTITEGANLEERKALLDAKRAKLLEAKAASDAEKAANLVERKASLDAKRAKLLEAKAAADAEKALTLEQKKAKLLAFRAEKEASLEQRKAMLEEKKAKILAARAASSNAAQQTGMPRPITTRNRY